MKTGKDYDSFLKSTEVNDVETDDIIIILNCLVLSIPSGVFLMSLKRLIIHTTLDPLLANK